jgi:putative ABC transport system permease protein
VAKTPEGNYRVTILLGVDDATLAGSPTADKMVLGSVGALREPDAVIIDWAGYKTYFPNAPLELGRTMELNDHRAKIVGIVEASAPYQTFPVMYTRYSLIVLVIVVLASLVSIRNVLVLEPAVVFRG